MICNKCNIDKNLTEFYKIKNTNYYRKTCKKCLKLYKKEKYQNNKNEILKRNKNYRYEKQSELNQKKKVYLKEFAKFETYKNKLEIFEEIRQDPNNNDLIQVKCSYCGKWFNPTNQEVSSRLKFFNGTNNNQRTHGESKFYCSLSCKQNCPTYKKKNKSDEIDSKKLNRELNPEFRKMIFLQDNYTCVFCGLSKNEDKNIELHCHHLIPFAQNPILENDLNNAITVCKDCHIWIHTNIIGCKYWEICK